MSAYFRCDNCGRETHPTKLFHVLAVTSNVFPTVVDHLHTGEICNLCVNEVRKPLPQPPRQRKPRKAKENDCGVCGEEPGIVIDPNRGLLVGAKCRAS